MYIDKNVYHLLQFHYKKYYKEHGSKYIDDTIVSTDSQEIARISREYGAKIPFMRPSELADDNGKTIDAVLHAIKNT